MRGTAVFNFPRSVRVPGFNVQDPNAADADATPGFAVPPGGYPPSGVEPAGVRVQGFNVQDYNAANAKTTPGFAVPAGGYAPPGVDPSGIVPVNCTSANGSTNCMTPAGQSFAEPAPAGFPPSIDPDKRNYHYYHFQSEPIAIPADRLRQAIIERPTPNFLYGRPATAEGTPNEATPDSIWDALRGPDVPFGGPFGGPPPAARPLNPVRSYVTRDRDGNPMVVNVTEPSHMLRPRYVAIYVTPGDDGRSIVHVEGEGLSPYQGPNSPGIARSIFSDQTWRPYFATIRARVR